ncbi:MAG: lysophospholipase [Cyclobacteriaceae bacterium]|nr:lysophospholipase [Cyclobacteriaceae bacterium]
MKIYFLIITLFITHRGHSQDVQTVKFPSTDGLTLTADLYMAHDKSAPMIVLFHQARWSRGEYQEIAPKLTALGFNCLAVDLRSGGEVNGVKNESFSQAQREMKPTKYVNAYIDIEAAVSYAKQYYSEGKLIIWGSSYSSALVLKYAGDNIENIDAVLSFSPGEYFASQGKSKTWITESASKITQPVFITSARGEKSSWSSIFAAIPSEHKTDFVPSTAGNHGSRALWPKFGDSVYYWSAVENFLNSLK